MDPSAAFVDPEFAKFATGVVGSLLALISAILAWVGKKFIEHTKLVRKDLAAFNAEAVDHLGKVAHLAELLMAEDPHAKMPNTPYVLSLITKFHDGLEELSEVHGKVDRILNHLNVPAASVAKRRISHD